MNRRRLRFTSYARFSRALLSDPLARPSSLRDRNTIVRSDYFFAAHRAWIIAISLIAPISRSRSRVLVSEYLEWTQWRKSRVFELYKF